jgi:hypothetical protein
MREQEKNRRSSGWVFVTGAAYSLQELASTQVIQSIALSSFPGITYTPFRFDRNPKFSCNGPGNQAKSDGFLLRKKMQIRYKGLGMGLTQNTLRSAQVLDL